MVGTYYQNISKFTSREHKTR